VHRPDNTVERKYVEGYDFVDGGSVTFRDQDNHWQTVSGHWVASSGWHQIPDSVINAYWGAGGISQGLLGGSEDHPKGTVPLSVYGGPNVSVYYYASQVTITGGYTDYGPWSDWSTTNPGPATDTMDVQTQQVSNHDGTAEYTLYYVHGSAPSTHVDDATWETTAPGSPWVQFDERKVIDTAAHDTDKYGDCVQPCSAFGTITTMANPDGSLPSTWDVSQTRSKGSNTVAGGVLNVVTQDGTSESKAAAYYAVDIPLANIGSPHLNYASTPTGVRPGFQLVLDDGRILVGEPEAYGDRWWSSTATTGVPSGDGYPASANLNVWLAALPDAHVTHIGYSLGSGVQGTAAISSLSLTSDNSACVLDFTDYVTDPCVSQGNTWSEEDGDIAPTAIPAGMMFAGPNTPAVDYYHPVSGNLEGVVGSSYTIAEASGYHAALVYEVNPDAVLNAGGPVVHYATIVIEPYMNGWAPGQTGTYTVTNSTLVWTSKITSGPGSQSHPISIDAMTALMPGNALISQGLHLGTNSVDGQVTVVSAVTGCGSFDFTGLGTLADFPTNLTWSDPVCTQGTVTGGTFTVGMVDGVSFFTGQVDYFLDGSASPLTQQTVSVAPGHHTVTAAPHDPKDGLDGETSWSFDIAPPGLCPTDLKTLAITGMASPAPWIASGALLFGVGVAFTAAAALRRRSSGLH
jgi:hypothetical protein